MKLFANCPHCKEVIKDKKLLQLLDVWKIHCPCCGKAIPPFSAAKSDIIVELSMDEAMPESSAFFGQPIDFKPNIEINLRRDEAANDTDRTTPDEQKD